MKFIKLTVTAAMGLMIAGCHEPPYRYDIRGRDQGGITLERIPKDAQPASSAPTETATAPSSPTTAPDQQRVDELEAQVRQLQAENEKLRQQSAGSTTAPSKP